MVTYSVTFHICVNFKQLQPISLPKQLILIMSSAHIYHEFAKVGLYFSNNEVSLQYIWKHKVISADWAKSIIIKLPKKGDLSDCSNWRGIALLPGPSMVHLSNRLVFKNYH